MKIEVSPEMLDEIITQVLENGLLDLQDCLEELKDTKSSSGIFSWEYKEEKREMKKTIKSIEITLDYFGIYRD